MKERLTAQAGLTLRLSYQENRFLELRLADLDCALTDEEEHARTRLREKFAPARKRHGWLTLTLEEIQFLAKVARDSVSFVNRREKLAHRLLGAKLANAATIARFRHG